MNLISIIGKGITSVVYKAIYNDMVVAIKVIKDDKDGVSKDGLSELVLLRDLNHVNIIKLYDVLIQDQLYLILEYADTDLSQHMKEDKNIFIQICEGVNYLHQQSIIHCDLKPQNILLVNNVVKIADFGLSQKIIIPTIKSHNTVSLWYRAPELLLKQHYSKPIDVWSLGCIYSEMMTKQVLFRGQSEKEQLKLINNYNPEGFLKHLLCDQKNRWTAEQTVTHLKNKN